MVIRNVVAFQLSQVLTLLTMAIGSMALAATFFAGEGALSRLWMDLDQIMGKRVIVYGDAGPNDALLLKRPSVDFTFDDLDNVRKRVVSAAYVVPGYCGRAYVGLGAKGRYMRIDGITSELHQEIAYRPLAGRCFSDSASEALLWECLVTESAASSLGLTMADPPAIRVGTRRFQVVGIVPDPPDADTSFQARIIVPFNTAQYLWGQPGIIQLLIVGWNHSDEMEKVVEALREALVECRGPDTYYFSSSQFTLKKRRSIVSNFMVFGTVQSLFCILVASIGIINVMLANVVRRTREFAIRVSMGAQHRDIVFMVLFESFLLGVMGAVIGIVVAVMLAPPLCTLITNSIPEAAQLKPVIGLKGILISLAVCGGSGFCAGIIPALRVRKLDILECLRAE